jgi:hypothetical protein
MKTVAFALAGLVAMLALGQAPALANDYSAQKRYSPFVTKVDPYTGERITVYRRNYLVPSNDFDGGAYAGEYAVRRAIGQCVIDLGYGRWEACK